MSSDLERLSRGRSAQEPGILNNSEDKSDKFIQFYELAIGDEVIVRKERLE